MKSELRSLYATQENYFYSGVLRMNGGDSQPEERICSVVCTSVSFATQQQGEQTEAGDVFQYILRCCAGELVSAQRHSLTGNMAPE